MDQGCAMTEEKGEDEEEKGMDGEVDRLMVG
jgi:hypothetical protein